MMAAAAAVVAGRGPAENADLDNIDRGRKGGGEPLLALKAFH